jgi:hypothetical protein
MKGRYLTILLVISFFMGFFSFSSAPSYGKPSEIKHVVLIVLDGVRPDRLLAANTPNMDNLMADGSYTWNAITVVPSVTLSAIPSIFTGATPPVHKVNDWAGDIFAETIIEVYEEAGLPTAIIDQDPILGGYSATYCTGYQGRYNEFEYYTTIAIDYFTQHNPFFITLYDPEPDEMAHEHGDQSQQYLSAIERADNQIGRIMDMLRELGVYDQTLIVITPDHGMTGFDHGAGTTTDMRIFSIFRGPGVKQGYEMENLENSTIGNVAHRIIDIAPTITVLSGLRPPANSEGRVIYQIFSDNSPLSASIDRSEATGTYGDNLEYTLTITNLRNKSENYNIEITSENGWPIKFSPQEMVLEPGESRNLVARVTVPNLKKSSDDVLLAKITGPDGSVNLEFKATGGFVSQPAGKQVYLFFSAALIASATVLTLFFYNRKKMSEN